METETGATAIATGVDGADTEGIGLDGMADFSAAIDAAGTTTKGAVAAAVAVADLGDDRKVNNALPVSAATTVGPTALADAVADAEAGVEAGAGADEGGAVLPSIDINMAVLLALGAATTPSAAASDLAGLAFLGVLFFFSCCCCCCTSEARIRIDAIEGPAGDAVVVVVVVVVVEDGAKGGGDRTAWAVWERGGGGVIPAASINAARPVPLDFLLESITSSGISPNACLSLNSCSSSCF
jgi:hypothetical protein